jgi:hypothetical protein
MTPSPGHADFEPLNALIDHIIRYTRPSVKQKDRLTQINEIFQMLILDNDGSGGIGRRAEAGNAARAWMSDATVMASISRSHTPTFPHRTKWL